MEPDRESNEAVLRQLAERLMSFPHPEGPTTAELFVRRLPDAAMPDVPLPDGARLLGSQLKRLAGRPAVVEAVCDVDREPTALLDGYEAELRRGGWSTFEGFGPPRGGFIGASMGDGRLLRQNNAGPVLAVSAVARDGASTDLRIRLDWEMARHQPRGPGGMPPGADLLPPLRAPHGSAMSGMSGGGGSGRWTSETNLETDRPVAEVEEHFADQLAGAGWRRTGGNADDVVAWSAWQLPGAEGWRGVLFVIAAFGPSESFVSVRIERRDSDQGITSYAVYH